MDATLAGATWAADGGRGGTDWRASSALDESLRLVPATAAPVEESMVWIGYDSGHTIGGYWCLSTG